MLNFLINLNDINNSNNYYIISPFQFDLIRCCSFEDKEECFPYLSHHILFCEKEKAEQSAAYLKTVFKVLYDVLNYISEEPDDGTPVWVSNLAFPDKPDSYVYFSKAEHLQTAYNNCFLFKSKEDAIHAAKILTDRLESESKRNLSKFKCLTEQPKDGTLIYCINLIDYPNFYYKFTYNSFDPIHQKLLNDKMLYPSKEGVTAAIEKIKDFILKN